MIKTPITISIITPMMLLALMRRSPLLIQTSQGKLPASLVSLAEARACRPSLLLMVIGVLIIGWSRTLVLRRVHAHLHHPMAASRQGTLGHGFQRLVAIAYGAQQHGQVHSGHQPPGRQLRHQALRHVAGRRAKEVARAMRRAGPRASPWCPRTAWSW